MTAGHGMATEQDYSGTGPIVTDLESCLAKSQNAKYCLTVNSGTTAIYLALLAAFDQNPKRIGVHPLAPSMAYIPILRAGHLPVLLDVDASVNFSFDVNSLNSAISGRKIDGVLTVGMWGQAPYTSNVVQALESAGICHIEDISQTHYSKIHGKFVGTFGSVGCSSLHNNKVLSSGEGGYLLTDDHEIYERLKKLRQFGSISDHDVVPSMNYKLSGYAAIKCSEAIPTLSEDILLRKNRSAEIKATLERQGIISRVPNSSPDLWMDSSCYGFYALLESSAIRDSVHVGLDLQGVRVDSLRYGVGPAYEKYKWLEGYREACPTAEAISARMLGLRIPKFEAEWLALLEAIHRL